MERQSSSAEQTSDYERRCAEVLALQRAFIFEEFVPRCEEIGMSREHAGRLIGQFFPGIGDIYRKTAMTGEQFAEALRDICDDLLRHTDDHKYFLSEDGNDVGWNATIDSLESVGIPSQLQIDHEEGIAYHDVYFPVVKPTDASPTAGREGRRMRSVIRLDAAGEEHIIDPIDLTAVLGRLRARMNGVLAQS